MLFRSITFATSDSGIVVVDEEGLITAAGTGTAVVTVESGTLSAQVVVDVGAALRRWQGSVSSDWAEPGNWQGGVVPSTADSVHIPLAGEGSHAPVLTGAAAIGHLVLEDGAALDLNDFDLTVAGSVSTGPTGGIEHRRSAVPEAPRTPRLPAHADQPRL